VLVGLNTNVPVNLVCFSHVCKQKLVKTRKQVEVLKKQLESNINKLKAVEATLQTNEEELEILQVRS
jgi:hypothetical protein